MEEKLEKGHNNIKTVIYVLVLLIVIFGVSFALYTNVFNGTKDVVIDTNNLKFNYNETTNSITLDNPDSLSDSEGLINGGTFTFDVSASSTKNQTVYYVIYLTAEGTNTMNSSYVRLALLDNSNNVLVNPVSYKKLKDIREKENAKLLYRNKINLPSDNDIKQNYVLKYWVSDEVDTITKETNGKKQTASLEGGVFKFRVNVMVAEPTGADTIIAKVGTGGLVQDTNEATSQAKAATSYRYTKLEPDNYVTFNNELWRIIGVFDVDDGSGNIEKRMKIIRNESIGNVAWDSNRVNDWTTATGMQLLNSGDYYNRTGSYASNGLTTDAKAMIDDAKWYLGGNVGGFAPAGTASQFYSYERGTTVLEGRPTSWVGKVGLMYVSDYGYATSGGITLSRDECLAQEIKNWTASSDCASNNWLYSKIYAAQWTITPNANYAYYSLGVNSDGYVDRGYIDRTFAFRPVVYLLPDVKIIGGNGNIANPYEILG